MLGLTRPTTAPLVRMRLGAEEREALRPVELREKRGRVVRPGRREPVIPA